MILEGKEILVTGGAGFIGSNLVGELSKKNHIYVIDSLHTGSLNNLKEYENVEFIKDYVKNISNYSLFPDYIFHIGVYSASPMYKANPYLVHEAINDMIAVLELAKKNKTPVVFASTSSIYNGIQPPHREDAIPLVTDFYTETRIAIERLANLYSKLYDLDISAMRFFSVYGYHEKSKRIYANLVSQFLWAMMSDQQPLIYGDGEQRRDFVFVDDVVDALILAATKNKGFGIYNVGTGINYSLNELVEKLNKHLKKDIQPKFIENPMAKTYVHETLADVTRAKEVLGFNPKITLDEGIIKLVKYYMNGK